mmetsp:Transcript_18918/g.34689  ORF Transcript_18918/g.34689 Transcript_18918/m.34689 type:complete len:276 (+) Transcript_18918:57-884(+)
MAERYQPRKRKLGLPLPGPDLHSGMFRKQFLLDVQRVKETLKSATCAQAILDALNELDDCVIDAQVESQIGIYKQVRALVKNPESDPAVVEKARSLSTQWKTEYDIRKKVVDSFKEKGGLTGEVARKMEENLFNAASPLGLLEGDGYRSYNRHFKRLCVHLRTQGSGSVSQRLADGLITAQEVAWLPDQHLMSLEQLEKEQTHRDEGLQAALAGQTEPEGIATDQFACQKCQSNRTVYTEKQTAWHTDGQDPTVLVTCLNCGYRWKANDDHGLAG